ncbi:hypothetical protein PEC301889_15710 [Pectobacterium carotovorum subsp. carotovorum]|nr:hypothetical protein PEC301889_15710 [Pectobacterium carotovorum subsp. carotovorum]
MPLGINKFAEWHSAIDSVFNAFHFTIKYRAYWNVIQYTFNNYDGNLRALFCAPALDTTQDFAAEVVIKLYE